MTLAELALRINPNAGTKCLVEDTYSKRIGRLVHDNNDDKWYLITLIDDSPKYLRDYKVMMITCKNNDLYIMVSW